MATSSPGQSQPAPSAAQKIPNVVSITPTANLSVFSGTRASGARTAIADHGNEHERAGGAGRGQRDRALRAAEGEHDEHDLESLEQHALERKREAVPVEAGALDLRGAARFGELLREERVLVVQRLVAAGAQDRLAQPLQAEDEQERADDEPQRLQRDRGERRPERGHDDCQHQGCRAEARERRSASRARARRPARS